MEDLLPGVLGRPSSIFISGADRSLLKWVAYAALSPYSERVYWTDVRLPGEIPDPLDPMTRAVIPAESVHVLLPLDLRPEEEEARRAETAAATMIRSEGAPDSLRRLIEFLRMPTHTQERISATYRRNEPAILVCANAHRLAGNYSSDRVAPLVKSIVESGACVVSLWSDAPTSLESVFDVVLHVEGGGSADWRSATIRCEKGIASGPLASGKVPRLADLKPIAKVLGASLPASS